MIKRLLPPAAVLALLSCKAPPADPANQAAASNIAAPAPQPAEGPAEPEAAELAEPMQASAAVPAAYHGIWEETPADCDAPSEFRLRVSEGELRFHESIGTVTAVAPVESNVTSVAADFQGEGESWSAVRELRLFDGGASLTVTGDGEMQTRVRCPDA